jgi:DNA repair protein RAD7
MKSLVKNCSDIIDLRLKEIGHMNDSFLSQIKLLKKGLRHLDLADPTESCTESAMIALMRSIGKSLTYLNVSKHDLLGDQFLSKALQPHAKALQSLTLSHLPELTDEGVSQFFGAWKNPPLKFLDISRNEVLGSLSLKSLVKHSGEQLEELNINGWKDVGEPGLKSIGRLAKQLKTLDVGWCRAVDDFLLKMWFEGELVKGVHEGGCKSLQEVKVWGCNKISHSCPRKVGRFFWWCFRMICSLFLVVVAEGCYGSWC